MVTLTGIRYTFDTIEKLQLQSGVIYLKNYLGGSYHMVLPISPPEYRKNYPTKATISVEKKEEEVIFTIVDDWGRNYFLTIQGETINHPDVQREILRCEKEHKD